LHICPRSSHFLLSDVTGSPNSFNRRKTSTVSSHSFRNQSFGIREEEGPMGSLESGIRDENDPRPMMLEDCSLHLQTSRREVPHSVDSRLLSVPVIAS